ncbi:MAG TPA: mechanosensitive ion channel domain-containing protein [Rudaea sp.]|nr:mechanosensitive ion channel domain-containing protein [Rudaea sp.]
MSKSPLRLILAGFALLLPILAAAQAPAPADAALPPSHATAIANALKSLPKQRSLSADDRKQAEDLLNQAQADESQADDLARQWQTLRDTADTADDAAAKIEAALAQDDSDAFDTWKKTLPEHASTDQLETMLAAERSALTAAHSAVTALDAEMRHQSTRPTQIRDELTAAYASLDAAQAPVAHKGESASLATARTLHTQAAERLASVQIALLELENRSYEPRMRLLSSQLRQRQRTIGELNEHVSTLEAMVLDRTDEYVDTLRTRVMQQSAQIPANAHALSDAANTNITLTNQLAQTITRLSDLRTQKQGLDSARQETEQALENTNERIRIGGVSEAVGLILLAEQRKLKPVSLLKRQLAELQTELAGARMDLIAVRERQSSLNDIDGLVDKTLARLPNLPDDRRNDVRTKLRDILDTRVEIVAQLTAQLRRLADTLSEVEQEQTEVTNITSELSAKLDERLLWTPSHAPVSASWLAQWPGDTINFLASRRWLVAASGAMKTALSRPLLSIGGALAVVLALLLGRRASARLATIAAPMRRLRTDRYLLTGEALAWTILRIIPAPLFLWLISRLFIQNTVNAAGFSDAIASAVGALVLPSAVLAYMRALTMEDGLAQYHFRWPRPRREAIHTAAPIFALIALPTTFFVKMMSRPDIDAPLDTFGRTLILISLIGTAWISWYLFAPGRLWTVRQATLQEPVRLRQTARIFFTFVCGASAILVLLGYLVTVDTLATHLVQTIGIALIISTFYGLAVRWLVLGERRLALKRMEAKTESETSSETTTPEGESRPEIPEAEEITIANLSAQTRRLLRALTIVVTASVLLWVWSDVTPALSLLGDYALWKPTQIIDGKEFVISVTVRDVIGALVVIVLTSIATRNLPGLLEVGILRRFHVDAATRYAMTSVTRYLIVFTGVILGLSMIGLRWANLQWLAAGFSVGLGFGLQEIFANFISGLIVLFERPFRIGDIVSIGGVEGVVARIRTRATTIVDWDNKEVVVPNKSFITDRLVNWTLSDATTRLVIKVGIAYRNDPREAQKILLDIAKSHPQVLADPAPSCPMTGFGDSTQNFELRVYVAEVAHRGNVQNELQFRIVEVCRENDIELAFPQRDVWIRNAEELRAGLAEYQPASAAPISDSKRD